MIKIYQIAIGIIPVEIEKMMNNVELFAHLNGFAYELIKPTETGSIFYIADTTRMQILCDDANALYCDWDFQFIKKFDFSLNDKPYFGFNHFGIPHYSLMYCNNQQEFFKNIFIEKQKRKIENVAFWPMKILRDKIDSVHQIDNEYFIHYEYSTQKTVFYAQELAIELQKAEKLKAEAIL